MAILCEINLFKSSRKTYLPGQSVTGLIKYMVDEPIEFEKITTSLKGRGLIFSEFGHVSHKYRRFLRSNEAYIDMDDVVQNTKTVIPIGSHEIKFSFNIPQNLPSSVNINKYLPIHDCVVKCKIYYYIRIKFKKPGLFARNKHFTKEIIIHGITPKLSKIPVIYEETKKLLRLFSIKDSNVNIKATILNSIITVGDKIELNYQVHNNSNATVKSVETKLIEIYKFHTTEYHEMRNEEIVPDTNSITSSISCGDTHIVPIKVNVPPEIHSLEYSQIVSRDYIVRIEAALPIPHKNLVLNIPIQIGVTNETADKHRSKGDIENTSQNDIYLHSHWETMTETKKRNDDNIESNFKMH